MLPPLALWVAGYVACGWWSGRSPDVLGRSIGVISLLAGSAVVNLYFRDYSHPSYHPPSTSLWTVAIGALKCLSLGIYPNVPEYWWPAGSILLAVLTPTLLLLAWVALRDPCKRPRALALLAILLAMLSSAVAVGVSRAGLGESIPVMSRYVTLTIPLLSTIYIIWLAYGGATARFVVPTILLALVVSTLPNSHRFSREYGWRVRVTEQRVEQALKNRAPTARVLEWACPHLYPHSDIAHACFKMLKEARMGKFTDYEEHQVATLPDANGAVRR
jgi:hypothetical protein